MCDWGESGLLQKVTPSLYGSTKEQNVTNAKKCIIGLPQNCFLFTKNQELQIPLDDWLSIML
jgi:hypothetical protein